MKKILPFALGISSLISQAQYEKKWDHTYGDPANPSYPEQICTDPSGNLLSATSFYIIHDIDPDPNNTVIVNPVAPFTYSAYIKKVDNDGNYMDHLFIACNDDIVINDMESDSIGNIYVTGNFRGTATFDSNHPNGTASYSKQTVFVAKFSSSFSLDWINYYGGPSNNQGEHIEISNNNIYVAGRLRDEIDFDSSSSAGYHSTGSASFNSGFILSLDYSGNYQNSADYYRVSISDLEADQDGNFIFSGTGWDQVNLDYANSTVSYTPNNTNFGVICRYNFGFGYENHFILDGGISTQNYIIDTELFSDGSIIAVGNSDGSQNLENGNPNSSVSSNVRFMFKLDDQSTYDWSHDNYGNKLMVDDMNNIYSYGEVGGSFDFDPSPTSDSIVSAQLSDPYLVKLDANGNFEWVKTLVSDASYAYLFEACLSPENEVFASGATDGSTVSMQGGGSEYALELKLGPNCAGLDNTLSTSGITLTANQNNAIYQWIDCMDNSPITGETGQSFTASSNGDYAVIVMDGVCSDTSDCVNINTVGMEEFTLEFSVFPNPANNLINVETNDAIVAIKLFNSIGQMVYTGKDKNIDLSSFSNGIYTLVVQTEKQIGQKSIIKE